MDSLSKTSLNISKGYEVLALKYRPKLFKELLGQNHVVRILQNALKEEKVHHAFLITGIRGVGKTTLARIIAMAVNCLNFNSNGTMEPCLKCTSCYPIIQRNQQDVIEIDAASNTGVGDIREVIDDSKYLPVNAQYKIFIIDEVHMLSSSAFNALLKILEEPPKHVKFILATTELKKVPLTIISRCQRLDLHRVGFESLYSHLNMVSCLENFTLEKEAAYLLINAAGGSVRDALSMLDQAVLCSQDYNIKVAVIEGMLAITSATSIYQIFSCIIEGDIKKLLQIIRRLYSQGANLPCLLTALSDIAHKISLLKINDKDEMINSDVEREYCRKNVKNLSMITLMRLWQMLQKSYADLKNSANELASVEMSMIKIIHANLEISPEEALALIHQCSDDKSVGDTIKKKE